MISRRVALLVRVAFSVRDIALYRVVWPRCCVISRRLALLLGNIALCGLFFGVRSRRVPLFVRDIASFGLVFARRP